MEDVQARILIVEDDPEVARLVERCLTDIGMSVECANTISDARDILKRTDIDIAIMDLGLPDGDGLTLTRELSVRDNLGVVILTGRGEVTDKIVGLELGADDYVTKPFERRELAARIKGLARRIRMLKGSAASVTDHDGTPLKFNGWTLYRDKMQIVHEDGRQHDLSASEYNLLKVFLDHPGRILSRDQIMDFLFSSATPAFDRSIDIRVSRLRAKLEESPRHPTLIVTARNMGYVFRGTIG